MIILTPSLTYTLSALIIFIIFLFQPRNKYIWLISFTGGSISLLWIFLWYKSLPISIYTKSWDFISSTGFYLKIDDLSWPFALSIAGLTLAGILTSVVRQDSGIFVRIKTLITAGLGILIVSAGNPFTLVFLWGTIDLFDFISTLRFIPREKCQDLITGFTIKVIGTGVALLIIADLNNKVITPYGQLSPLLFFIFASAIRITGIIYGTSGTNEPTREHGALPLLVSVLSSLMILIYIPKNEGESSLIFALLLLLIVASLSAALLWVRSPDEWSGRPYWIMGMTSLAMIAALHGNILGIIAWGLAITLSGGLLFFYTARDRRLLPLLIFGLWGASAFSFSASSMGFTIFSTFPWPYWIPILIAHSILLAGFLRHSLNSGTSSIESYQRSMKIIYIIGLSVLPSIQLMIGLWGWKGARMPGTWWASSVSISLGLLFTWIAIKFSRGITNLPKRILKQEVLLKPFFSITDLLNSGFKFFDNISQLLTDTIEGENGILWSLLILTLLISLLIV